VACIQLSRSLPECLGVARREDKRRTFGARAASCFETDPCASAKDDDRLAE